MTMSSGGQPPYGGDGSQQPGGPMPPTSPAPTPGYGGPAGSPAPGYGPPGAGQPGPAQGAGAPQQPAGPSAGGAGVAPPGAGGPPPGAGSPPPGAGSPPGGPPPGPVPSPQGEGPNLINGATRHGLLGQKQIRHPWELPLLYVGIAITIISYVTWVGMLIYLGVSLVRDGEEGLDRAMSFIGQAPILVQLLLIVPLLPLLIWWVRAVQYAALRASAVRMSPTQFPEGYRIVVEAARQYGMRRVPDAYVMLGQGQINAFAAGHGFRRYVTVYSDMFEVGGAARDPEALRFIIGHEVGHLAAGHVGYFRLLFTNIFASIPLLGPAFSRAQEYTADNFGYSFAPAGAPGTIGVLGAGKYLNAEVNFHEVADRAATDPSFFVHWVNLTSSHPITTWRAHALRDRSKPGSLWIRPSGALFRSPLPPGSAWSSAYPTPETAFAMLSAAEQARPAGLAGQFGRFPGADDSARPSLRQVQLAAPMISDRTAYVIPPGPYRDDARGPLQGAAHNPFAPPSGGQQGPPMPPRG